MSYMTEYGESCDFVREKFKLPDTISIYELVVRLTDEFKLIEDKLQKLEKSCQMKPKKQTKQLKSVK